MAKTRTQKTSELEVLVRSFKTGKAAAFADYQGMKVAAISKLRKTMHESKVDYVVAKKSLLSLAAKEAGYDIKFNTLPGMLGVAFAQEDEMAAAKIIGDAGKNQPIKLVGGIFEGKFMDQPTIIALSKLPNKQQLLGQLLNVFNGPISGLARVLNAYREKQEGVTA